MQNIENYTKAAKHSEEAAKQYHEAAKHIEEGNYNKAQFNIIKAFGHTAHIVDLQKEMLKEQSLK